MLLDLTGDGLTREIFGLGHCSKHRVQSDEVHEVPSLETFGHMVSFTSWSQDIRHMYLQDSGPRIYVDIYGLIMKSYHSVVICCVHCNI